MPNEDLIVPTYPKPVDDISTCRRSSLGDTVQPVSRNNHLVVPLMSSTNTTDVSNYHQSGSNNTNSSSSSSSNNNNNNNSRICNGLHQGLNKIDPVAISLAVKAKRQQQHEQQEQNTIGALSSPNQKTKQQNVVSQLYTNRRGSLDANVEYAVAMVNIVNPIYDMDDRDMCPFGTRRDSVCGGYTNHTNNNNNHHHMTNQKHDSPTRALRRILKKEFRPEPESSIDVNDPTTMSSHDTAL